MTHNLAASGIARIRTSRSESFDAFDALPAVVRERLRLSSLAISPVTLWQHFQVGINQGRSEAEMIRVMFATIEANERYAAQNLERARATWTLGKDIAEAMKAAHQKRMEARR